METASVLISLMQYWLYAGAVVAVAFVLIGIDRIDENARGAYTFRPLLIPAVLLLWPLVIWRWVMKETGRPAWQEAHKPLRGAHGPVWIILAVLIPVVFITALVIRQPGPANVAPVHLSPAVR